ncbi:[protein-PII] uridylyltransferase [Caenispirillum bisanense]|uniref:Bifunctional uridylyltransferase/uridylyl-removing enzyme n=1 Tax=Caenispirillum bisanense TaxID=414052 RepID=A0A286GXZ8_9PROT|nr:[protein-PII] uridylyltransferase [Caenispirillum bisanense]SOE00415.1 UTP--GlnB (protein PII) uridylyltransferase, GlnD [Caenispirillum bisanense]
MLKIRKPRAVIDRKALVGRLEDIATDGALLDQKKRLAALGALKDAYKRGHEEVRRRFEDEHGRGDQCVRENCYLVDQLVLTLFDYTVTHVYPARVKTMGEHLAVLAVGGYGRRELSPQSDIDLLFLLPYKTTPYSEQVVEYMLYMLWDIGLKVGHATRSVSECMRQAKADITIRTAMLEARYLVGQRALWDEFQNRYKAEIIAGTGLQFVEQKLAERDQRHDRLGDSRYVLEPNVKEDKGGLRDLHTLYWIAKYLYGVSDMRQLAEMEVISEQAATTFIKAQTFLWSVRCALHYLTGRTEDRLTFDMQSAVAEKLGYTDRGSVKGVERFMKHYFLVAKDVGDLTRIFCAVLEERNRRKPKVRMPAAFRKRNLEGFVVEGSRIAVAHEGAFAEEPVRLLSLFHVAQRHGLDIHPDTLRQVTETLQRVKGLRSDPEANRLFVEMLSHPKDAENTLRRLNESGVFGAFIPDFARVVAQMQYDMYHVYTTDEHTIRAIGILNRIEQGKLAHELPLSTQLIQKVQSRRALYVSVMLHDIAKGRGGDHSEIGAKIALKLCPRLGLTPEETETVSWLVLHHLDMSRTAFKRDVDDPDTIKAFAGLVQSPERLKLLTLLTCADIRAVGPQVWNGWKGTLLRELFYRTEDALSGGLSAGSRDARVARKKEALGTTLEATGWTRADIDEHMARGYPSYWLTFDTVTQQHHAELVRKAEREGRLLTVDSRVDEIRGVTDVTIYAADHPGLFSKLTGAMSLSGVSIVDAKIMTLTTGMALDTFSIQETDGSPVTQPDKLKRLADTIEKALSGRIWLERELAAKPSGLPSRTRVFKVPPRVLVDNTASKTYTVIEVNGRDRPGFLYDVTAALTRCGLQIHSAQVTTYGERVVDVFYVKDVFGMKVEHDAKLRQVRETLMETLEGRSARSTAPQRKKTAAAE